MMLGERLPDRYCVWLQRKTGAVKYDASAFGVWEAPPRTGAGTGYRGPELLNALRQGQVVPARHPVSFDARGVTLADGAYHRAGPVVIMATGFLPVLHQYLDIDIAIQHRNVLSGYQL